VRQRGVATVRQISGGSITRLVALWLTLLTGDLAYAQAPSPAGAIGLGNRGWSAADTNHATSASELEFSARAGLASDYVYRGVTLSDHGPAAGAALEARLGQLYAGTTVASVNLPTQPAAEFTYAAGIRPKFATIDFDFGMTYSLIPEKGFPARPTESIIGRRSSEVIEESANKSTSPQAMPIRRMSPTPGLGANMWRLVLASTCRANCCRRT
jgi:hypothetical protein